MALACKKEDNSKANSRTIKAYELAKCLV